MAGLSCPLQELLQTSRPSTQTSASISPGGGSSKSDTEPQPATLHRVPALRGLAPLRGSLSSPTAGPKTAERFSCRERAGFRTSPSHPPLLPVYLSGTPGLFLASWREISGGHHWAVRGPCCFCHHGPPPIRPHLPQTRTPASPSLQASRLTPSAAQRVFLASIFPDLSPPSSSSSLPSR